MLHEKVGEFFRLGRENNYFGCFFGRLRSMSELISNFHIMNLKYL